MQPNQSLIDIDDGITESLRLYSLKIVVDEVLSSQHPESDLDAVLAAMRAGQNSANGVDIVVSEFYRDASRQDITDHICELADSVYEGMSHAYTMGRDYIHESSVVLAEATRTPFKAKTKVDTPLDELQQQVVLNYCGGEMAYISTVEEAQDCGDGLLTFCVNEANDADGDVEQFREYLDKAVDQLSQLRDSLDNTSAPANKVR